MFVGLISTPHTHEVPGVQIFFTFLFVNSGMQLQKQKVLPFSDSAETLQCTSH